MYDIAIFDVFLCCIKDYGVRRL